MHSSRESVRAVAGFPERMVVRLFALIKAAKRESWLRDVLNRRGVVEAVGPRYPTD